MSVLRLNKLHSQSNIFIDEDWHVRLADFGLAGWASSTLKSSSNYGGSVRWMAPELHDYEGSGTGEFCRTTASDTYAFACVCIEVSDYHSLLFHSFLPYFLQLWLVIHWQLPVRKYPNGFCRHTTSHTRGKAA